MTHFRAQSVVSGLLLGLLVSLTPGQARAQYGVPIEATYPIIAVVTASSLVPPLVANAITVNDDARPRRPGWAWTGIIAGGLSTAAGATLVVSALENGRSTSDGLLVTGGGLALIGAVNLSLGLAVLRREAEPGRAVSLVPMLGEDDLGGRRHGALLTVALR